MRQHTTPIAIMAALLVRVLRRESDCSGTGAVKRPGGPRRRGERPRFPRVDGTVRGRGELAKRSQHAPGKEKWTFGAGQGVFAESPDRIYYIQRGSLPVIPPQGRGGGTPAPKVAPNLSFPVADCGATRPMPARPERCSSRARKRPGDDSDRGRTANDFLWANCILVINRAGDIIENWSQWDKMLRRPHSVYISPYDAQKNVYIVDDYRHAIFKFSHDGKQLLKTIGTPNVPGSDSTHFYRPRSWRSTRTAAGTSRTAISTRAW